MRLTTTMILSSTFIMNKQELESIFIIKLIARIHNESAVSQDLYALSLLLATLKTRVY